MVTNSVTVPVNHKVPVHAELKDASELSWSSSYTEFCYPEPAEGADIHIHTTARPGQYIVTGSSAEGPQIQITVNVLAEEPAAENKAVVSFGEAEPLEPEPVDEPEPLGKTGWGE